MITPVLVVSIVMIVVVSSPLVVELRTGKFDSIVVSLPGVVLDPYGPVLVLSVSDDNGNE